MAHSDNQLPFTNFLLNLKAQRIFFEPCTYNRSTGKIDVHLPSGKTVGLDREQFNVHFGGRTFIMDAYNERTSRDAWEAFT